ncbi:MAG TPA: hypothetical protein VGM44_12815, partial [Polyangiaceae bacterium]
MALACSHNPYVIGAACPGADGAVASASVPCSANTSGGTGGSSATDRGVSFALDLDQSGTSRISKLELDTVSLGPTLLFRGEDATLASWHSEFGNLNLMPTGTAKIGLLAPFTDGTRAVELGGSSASYVAESADGGDVGSDDFALELVFRAAPSVTLVDKRGAGAGWAVRTMAGAAVTLELQDANQL